MNHVEIARVQLRKATQQIFDLREALRADLDGALAPGMLDGLCACVDEHTWILGHGYTIADPQPAAESSGGLAGVVLVSDEPGAHRLLVQFVGRTQVPTDGGFAADVYAESEGGWERRIGLSDWRVEQLDELPDLWSDIPDLT